MARAASSAAAAIPTTLGANGNLGAAWDGDDTTKEDSTIEDDTMVITLTRPLAPTAGAFGLAYCVLGNTADSEEIIITAVLPHGAADHWNGVSHSSLNICTGDVVLSCNGVTSARQIIQDMRQNDAVQLRILKSGPRWHLTSNPRHERGDESQPTATRRISHHSVHSVNKVPSLLYEEPAPEPQHPVRWHHILGVWSSTILPPLVVLATFSSMSIGLQTYGFLAPYRYVVLGDATVCAAVIAAMLLYITDWRYWRSVALQVASAAVVAEMLSVGLVMKVRKYPVVPLALGIFHVAVLLGILRGTAMKFVPRGRFYVVVAISLFVTALLLLAAWLLWIFLGDYQWERATWDRLIEASSRLYEETKLSTLNDIPLDYTAHCDKRVPKKVRYANFSAEAIDQVEKACATVKTIWVMAYNCPAIMALCSFIMGLFCAVNAKFLDGPDTTKLTKVLKQFVFFVTILAMGFYCAASLSGASMRLSTTIMAFLAVAFLCLLAWFYIEIGDKAVSLAVHASPLMQQLLGFATSDWARAAFVLVTGGVTIPGLLALNALNQMYRKRAGTAVSAGVFTERATKVFTHLRCWNWASILCKLNILAEVFFVFQVLVSKVCYVFLSWLNEQLAQFDLTIVVAAFFAIGFLMFLLPPVPGVPVYVCAGVVVTARAEADGLGFFVGVAIAEAVAFLDKMVASSAQYLLGYWLGTSVEVQKQVGVDKVLIRSVEKILLKKGLSVAKCAILVGGPDWPTSVLCGILKLNLLQVLWGTAPVVITQVPCVIAGAFLTQGPQGCPSLGEGGEDSGNVKTLASSALIASLTLQMASMVLAMYFITQVMDQHGKELAQPREEHRPIEELAKQQEAMKQCYLRVTQWQNLSPTWKLVLVLSSGTMLGCFFVFLFFDPQLFEEFDVSSKIRCPTSDYGLSNDVTNLVKPMGSVVLIAFAAACALHYLFVRLAKGRARLLHQGRCSLGGGSGSPGGD